MAAPRLSDAQKQELLGRFRDGESSQALADHYGCSANTVTRVVKGLLQPAAYEELKRIRSRRLAGSAAAEAGQVGQALQQPELSLALQAQTGAASDPLPLDRDPLAAAAPLVRDGEARWRSDAAADPAGPEAGQRGPRPHRAEAGIAARHNGADPAFDRDGEPEQLDADDLDEADLEEEEEDQEEEERRDTAAEADDPGAPDPDATDFAGTDLAGTDLDPTDLDPTDLETTDLAGTDLDAEDLDAADMDPEEDDFGQDDLEDDLLDEQDLESDDLDAEAEDGDDPDGSDFRTELLAQRPACVVIPWSDGDIPDSGYLLVDKTVELQALPLAEIPELGLLAPEEEQRQALVVYTNPRQAKRLCGRSQRVIRIPDTQVLARTAPYLLAQGISRVVIEGSLYALPER